MCYLAILFLIFGWIRYINYYLIGNFEYQLRAHFEIVYTMNISYIIIPYYFKYSYLNGEDIIYWFKTSYYKLQIIVTTIIYKSFYVIDSNNIIRKISIIIKIIKNIITFFLLHLQQNFLKSYYLQLIFRNINLRWKVSYISSKQYIVSYEIQYLTYNSKLQCQTDSLTLCAQRLRAGLFSVQAFVCGTRQFAPQFFQQLEIIYYYCQLLNFKLLVQYRKIDRQYFLDQFCVCCIINVIARKVTMRSTTQ
eukprot:TRINITY_DN4197_c1_g1_i10.p1 TRINITY_DN4197_c1_g1~~TRINITY_DN4197_c1_g1_i10.p1  ORF type:complete len:249 (-),score=-18.01 TRINITY_DN4197_c1_g1_i10:65-811(-)